MAPPTHPRHIAYAERRKTEITLGGAGEDWDLHFANNPGLSDAITFKRNQPDPSSSSSSSSSTTTNSSSRITLSIFGIDGAIKFRESRIFTVTRPDREGVLRTMDEPIWAAVETRPDDFEVLRHEEVGADWITLIKLKPERSFTVTNVLTTSTFANRPVPANVSLDVLRLWQKRAEVQGMRYLAVRVKNHKSYTPWILVLNKGMLGPVVAASSSSTPPPPSPSKTMADPPAASSPAPQNETDLIDLSSEEETPAAGPSTLQPQPTIDLLTGEEEGTADPFENVWEHAKDQERGGKRRRLE